MPVLRDPKHEIFAQELAAGKSAGQAYLLAGYKPHRGNCHRMSRRADVRSRVDEIQGQAAELAEIQLARVLVELGRVAFFNAYPFLKRTAKGKLELKNGMPSIDFERLTPEAFAAIAELDHESGRAKVHSKTEALLALLKHCGGMPDPEPARQNVNIFSALSLDDQLALAGLLEALPGGAPAAGERAAGERGAPSGAP